MLTLHARGHRRVDVGYLQIVEGHHLGEHSARIVGSLQQSGNVDRLEVTDERRVLRQLVVGGLDWRLTAPHSPLPVTMCDLNVIAQLKQSLDHRCVCLAGRSPGLDVRSGGQLSSVLQPGHLGRLPIVDLGQVLARQSRLGAQASEAVGQRVRLGKPIL